LPRQGEKSRSGGSKKRGGKNREPREGSILETGNSHCRRGKKVTDEKRGAPREERLQKKKK